MRSEELEVVQLNKKAAGLLGRGIQGIRRVPSLSKLALEHRGSTNCWPAKNTMIPTTTKDKSGVYLTRTTR